MVFIKTFLPLVLVWLISFPLDAAPTLTLTYAGDSAKPVTGVKITMAEADGTVTILSTDTNGQVTLPTTSNTYTLAASLAETGTDPVDLLDAIWILQHSGELRTLTTEQLKAADVSGDDEVDLLDAIYILQHSGELRTLSPSLVFLDVNTGNPLSEITFNPDDTPSITVVRTGDVDQGFDPTAITDHAPILTGKTTLTMDENETAVSTLLGTDADADTLTYEITGGADKDLFAIDASTGALSFKTGPDYEDPGDAGFDNLFDVEITVSDGTNTTSQALTITVTNVNETSPVISSSATFSAAENQTAVGTVSASDADVSETLTYALTGTDASSFNISTSGVITFNSAPDYETKTSYSVTVNVTDGTNTTSQALTITVTNVNDVTPVITSASTFSVAEHQTTVDTITATDAEGDALTYSLSGTDASSFSISSTGVITFNSAPNYETDQTSYSVTITVSDGVNLVTQNISINATDIVEEYNAPVLSELAFSPSNVNVASSSTEVSASIRVTDETEVVTPSSRPFFLARTVNVGPIYANSLWTLSSGDNKNGVYSTTFTITQGQVPDEYSLGTQGFSDTYGISAGCNSTLSCRASGQASYLTVSSSTEANAPVLSELSFSPISVDISHTEKTLNATIRVQDESGASPSNSPPFLLPSGFSANIISANSAWTLSSGSNKDGIYSATFSLPTNTVPGKYTLGTQGFSDIHGNSKACSSVSTGSDECISAVQAGTDADPYKRYITLSNLVETYNVTVVNNGSQNVYAINGVQQQTIEARVGGKYIFNHPTEHPLRFSVSEDGTHGLASSPVTYSVDYSSGVTTLEVSHSYHTQGTTVFYYYCANNSGMGGRINLNN